MFFSSNDSGQKRDLALLRAALLVVKANPNPTQYIKIGQDTFIRTLSGGLGRSNPLFTQKAESMSYEEMASILRNRSNFDKRSIAETLSAALYQTGNSIESKEVLMNLAFECDIPLNYFRF
ncbi:MAG: hypothetical protein IKW54_05600 [Bacteroidales bacterium]|nr:hypothetical protein [Bacteroidales bacterium]